MERLAVITGGSSGIGRHLVEAFVEAGYRVVFSFKPDGTPVKEAMAREGAVHARPCDVGDEQEVNDFYDWIASNFGVPDVLVNNAGIQTWSPLMDLSLEQWDAVIRTNLTGCFLNTRAVSRLMHKAGQGGAIINIGSGCNKLAFPKLVDYTASKGGVEQFTKVSAVELGPLGIRVNCVAPGAIETERTQVEAGDYQASWARITPLGRVGVPADIAGPVLFLASRAADFVTGQTLWVDGGVFTQANWPY